MSVAAVSKISCFTGISDIPRNKKSSISWEGSAVLRDLNQRGYLKILALLFACVIALEHFVLLCHPKKT